MPNHVSHHLVVTAPDDPETLLKFARRYTDIDAYPDFDPDGTRLEKPRLSHAFLPMPAELNVEVPGANPPWYAWAVDNWGTKWGTYQESHEAHEDRVVIRFDTAWSPPIQLLEAIAGAMPALRMGGFWNDEGSTELIHFTVDADRGYQDNVHGLYRTWRSDDGKSITTQYHELDGTEIDPPRVTVETW